MSRSRQSLKANHTEKTLVGIVLIVVFLGFAVHLIRGASIRLDVAGEKQAKAVPSSTSFPSSTATKWWIKRTATSPALSPMSTRSTCIPGRSSALKSEIFAYVSVSPPLPNRIRASASLASSFIGQVEPGGGVKIVAGPICVDGYTWWLIESIQGNLRGWTVDGKGSDPWIVPCPNMGAPCSQAVEKKTLEEEPVPENTRVFVPQSCGSQELVIGRFARVRQDHLLTLRSEPYSGEVTGRAGPLSLVKVIHGPACAGAGIWWEVSVLDSGQTGWATEDSLSACAEESECKSDPS